MKNLRWKAVLKSMGYTNNKKLKCWSSDDHILLYHNKSTGKQILESIKEMEKPECWSCGGDGIDFTTNTCAICGGKGWVVD